MVRSRMDGKLAIVDVSFSVGAQLIAIWFVRAYSEVVLCRLPLVLDDIYLAVIHRFFANHWQVLLLLPLLTVVLSILLIRMNSVIGIHILCRLGWLLALALTCYVIVVWEHAFLPVIRLS